MSGKMDFNYMLMPTFGIGAGRIIPVVRLPRDFRARVPIFYAQGRSKDVKDYAVNLAVHMENCGLGLEGRFDPETDLTWDDSRGLTMIKVRPSRALDLDDRHGWPNFAEHNLGGIASFFAGSVAMQYVSELMKCDPESTS